VRREPTPAAWLAFRLLLGLDPLDFPKLPERQERTTGKRSNAPLLWLQDDGSRR
jgi:hypothetical protein